MLESSAAGGGEEAKPWAFDAGTRAIQAHCDRIGLQAKARRDLEYPGVYHLDQAIESHPTVSIVIPSAGQKRDVWFEDKTLVSHCVNSIVEKTTYENYEIVVVANGGFPVDAAEQLLEAGGERLRLVEDERPFNFSSRINKGVVNSGGEMVLLLNDDMEVVTQDWIERLVMYASLDGVGAVGGKLLLQDGRLQHVGVELSRGLPGHPYREYAPDFDGYSNQVRVARNLLAVTGACLMTPRRVFDEIGGLSPELPYNYNDVDYCLKAWKGGYRTVYDPDCVLYHFESSSRSSEVEEWEKETFLERWASEFERDPYVNAHLSQGMPRMTSALAWAERSSILPSRRRWRVREVSSR